MFTIGPVFERIFWKSNFLEKIFFDFLEKQFLQKQFCSNVKRSLQQCLPSSQSSTFQSRGFFGGGGIINVDVYLRKRPKQRLGLMIQIFAQGD